MNQAFRPPTLPDTAIRKATDRLDDSEMARLHNLPRRPFQEPPLHAQNALPAQHQASGIRRRLQLLIMRFDVVPVAC